MRKPSTVIEKRETMATITASRRELSSFDLYKQGYVARTSRPLVRIESGSLVQSRVQPRLETHRPLIRFTPKRIFILFFIAVALFAVILPANTAFGRRSLASSGRPAAVSQDSVSSVVVRQGDTLWSIALRLEPQQDPRGVVDELVKARGTSSVYVGETIKWSR